MRVLIVDGQHGARRAVSQILRGFDNVSVAEAESLAAAQAAIQTAPPDLLLIDVNLSEDRKDRGGLELLSWCKAAEHRVATLMLATANDPDDIRQAWREGADDYVLKHELSGARLRSLIERLGGGPLLRERERSRAAQPRQWQAQALVGSSPAMERVRRLVERIADATAPVLIRGETGTGKELVARALHHMSIRHEHPFLAVNCSAIPGTLMESLIFGHERGAFTGADRRVRGQLELAGEGTILLDEIAEMPPELQAKLLRVLEERRFRPLGSESDLPLRARVLAATHIDLEDRIAAGRFREDLFFRLNVVGLELPSLADRREDIAALLQAFVVELPRKLTFTDRALAWLRDRPWPGNVRELRNAVERMALLCDTDCIDASDLEHWVGRQSLVGSGREIEKLARSILALPVRVGSKLDVIERAVLQQAIDSCGGNKSAAARLIGVDRKALERKWERLSDPQGVPGGSTPTT